MRRITLAGFVLSFATALLPARAADPAGTAPDPKQAFEFRHVVLNNAGDAPELCLRFTQNLDPHAEAHYADYVGVTPAIKPAVRAIGTMLCLGGLAYGTDYTVTLHRGLPSAAGARLGADENVPVSLGDRPPLTPTESFYQRILADDADEALDQAEQMLKDMPLARYYDEVALPGMQLAAQDAELGNLSEDQQENIKNTIYELVEGLSEHQDRADKNQVVEDEEPQAAPPPPFKVLSIAGRGQLDEPASRMLLQLFEQLGISSRLVKYRDVSRYSVEALDVSDVSMVCIAYLSISGSPAHLRYLVQRLRKRLPEGIPVLVGLWPQGDITEATRDAIGADYFASSVEEVLKCCQSVRAAGLEREVAAPL